MNEDTNLLKILLVADPSGAVEVWANVNADAMLVKKADDLFATLPAKWKVVYGRGERILAEEATPIVETRCTIETLCRRITELRDLVRSLEAMNEENAATVDPQALENRLQDLESKTAMAHKRLTDAAKLFKKMLDRLDTLEGKTSRS